MAGGMKLHTLIRKLHLIASMIILSFLLIYVITGLFMMNRNLFEIPPVEQKHSKILVEKPMEGAPDLYAQYLKEWLDLKGRTTYEKDWQENWNFYFNFRGDDCLVRLTPAQDTLYIKHSHQEMTLFLMLHKIHVLREFGGGWAYTAWAVMYDVSCFAMLIFAITGIIMWFRVRKRFRYGWWYLATGILIPVGIIYLYIFWK